MAKYTINDTTLTSIADAIRAKGGTSAALTPAQMPEAIAAIQVGGGGGGNVMTGELKPTEDTEVREYFRSNPIPNTLDGIPNLYAFIGIDAEVKEGQRYARAGIIITSDVNDKDKNIGVTSGMSSATATSWSKMATDNNSKIANSGASSGKYAIAYYNATNNTVHFAMNYNGYAMYMQAGKTYRWIAAIV